MGAKSAIDRQHHTTSVNRYHPLFPPRRGAKDIAVTGGGILDFGGVIGGVIVVIAIGGVIVVFVGIVVIVVVERPAF